MVRREKRLGKTAIFWIREVLHRSRDEPSLEHKRERVDVPQQLIS